MRCGKGSYVLGAEALFDFSEVNFTREMTKKEFQDISVLREMLEEKALELIITSKEPVDLKYFSAAYQGLVEATKALDAEQYTIYDAKFHLSLIAATGNDKLIQIAQIFKNDFYLFQHESNKFLLRNSEDQEKQREHFREAMSYHDQLHEAITSGAEESVDLQKRFFARNFTRLSYYYKKEDDGLSTR